MKNLKDYAILRCGNVFKKCTKCNMSDHCKKEFNEIHGDKELVQKINKLHELGFFIDKETKNLDEVIEILKSLQIPVRKNKEGSDFEISLAFHKSIVVIFIIINEFEVEEIIIQYLEFLLTELDNYENLTGGISKN